MQSVSYPDLRWYFVYEEFDSMENTLARAIVHSSKYMGLQIESPEEAERVGLHMWKEIAKTPYKGWDGHMYPRNPRIICKSDEFPLDIPQSA